MRTITTRLLPLICLLIAGCEAMMQSNYSVGFDMRKDGQDAEVLDYRYMADERIQHQADRSHVAMGARFTQEGVYGGMRRGTSLYVKWINVPTGQVHEVTADLRAALRGRELEGKTLYFMIYGPQLYVYLISEERRPEGKPPMGPKYLQYYDSVELYPKIVE